MLQSSEMTSGSITESDGWIESKLAGIPTNVSLSHAATVRQSSGSILMMEAPSLLPTQKATGVVLLSTKTRRMLVERGSR